MKHRSYLMGACAALVFAASPRPALAAQPLPPQEMYEVFQTLAPNSQKAAGAANPVRAEAPRVTFTSAGYLRYLGAPPGNHFAAEPGAAGIAPERAAERFLLKHGRLFGIQSPGVGLVTKQIRKLHGLTHVRMQQTYNGLPVVAAEVTVQVNELGAVQSVLGALAAQTDNLDAGRAGVAPALSAVDAVVKARAAFAAEAPGTELQTSVPVLAIFAPETMSEPGPAELIWDLEISAANPRELHYRVLVNAMTGVLIRTWTLNRAALSRQVWDKQNNPNGAAVLVRANGSPPSGNTVADALYDHLGDAYNFYFSRHGWDSWDGKGTLISATNNYCDPTKICPWTNANASLSFGTNFASSEDIVAHEFTHDVTFTLNGLIGTNVSGALDESLSDVFGTFIEQTYQRGTTDPAKRWIFGKDLPTYIFGAQRSMKDPPYYSQPDRLSSPNYQPPSNTTDNGGVHNNDGVNNKLCFLLTDGQFFNGQSVYGMGLNEVENLYWQLQIGIFLPPGATWTDLYNGLRQSALDLGWSPADRDNLERACAAVEIMPPGRDAYVDPNIPCANQTGTSDCIFGYGPYLTILQGLNESHWNDVLHIRSGYYHEPNLPLGNKMITLRAEGGPVTIGQ